MMKSMPGLLKVVLHLTNYVEVFGIEVESDLTQNWKYTDRCCCQPYYTHAKHRQLPTACQKIEPLPYKLSFKTSKDQVARQDSSHRSPEKKQECRVYILFWNWHSQDVQAMLQECLMNVCKGKSSMENCKSENAPIVFRRSHTRTPSKPPLKISTY